jgi:hypothetical protein
LRAWMHRKLRPNGLETCKLAQRKSIQQLARARAICHHVKKCDFSQWMLTKLRQPISLFSAPDFSYFFFKQTRYSNLWSWPENLALPTYEENCNAELRPILKLLKFTTASRALQ